MEFLARPSDDDADGTDDRRATQSAVPAVRDQTERKQPDPLKRKRPVVYSSSDEVNESATESEYPYSSGSEDGSSPSLQGHTTKVSRAAAGQRHGVQVVIVKYKPNSNTQEPSPNISSSGSDLSSSGNGATNLELERYQHRVPQGMNAPRQPAGHPAAGSSNVLTPQAARVSNATPSSTSAVSNGEGTSKLTNIVTPSNGPDTARSRPPPPIPGPSIPIVHTPSTTTNPSSQPLDLAKRYQIYTYISATFIPLVIGKNGSNVKAVEKKFEARVSVINNAPPTSANERIVMIRGTMEQCQRAENAIKALAMSHRLEYALTAKMVHQNGLVFDFMGDAVEEDLRAFAARHRLF